MRVGMIIPAVLVLTGLSHGADWAVGVAPSDFDALKKAYESRLMLLGGDDGDAEESGRTRELSKIRLARDYRSRLVDLRRYAASADDDAEEADALTEIARIDRWLASAQDRYAGAKCSERRERRLPGGLEKGLLLRYTFDKGEKGQVLDSSPRTHDAVPRGGRPVAQGLTGNGWWFDGVDDHLVVPDGTSFWHRSELTVSVCVFRHAVEEKVEHILSRGDLKVRDIWLDVGSDRRVRAGIRHGDSGDGGPVVERLISGGVLPSSRWVHMVFTYDGERMLLYIDGKRDGACVAPGGLAMSGAPLSIGRSGPGRRRHGFIGVIDDIIIWDRALSEVEVLGLSTWVAGKR